MRPHAGFFYPNRGDRIGKALLMKDYYDVTMLLIIKRERGFHEIGEYPLAGIGPSCQQKRNPKIKEKNNCSDKIEWQRVKKPSLMIKEEKRRLAEEYCRRRLDGKEKAYQVSRWIRGGLFYRKIKRKKYPNLFPIGNKFGLYWFYAGGGT